MDSSRGKLRNQVISSLVWLWWVIDLASFELKSRTVSVGLLLSSFHLKNHVCLSCGVQVTGATWHATMRIVTGVGDLVQRTGDGHTCRILGGRAIERSGGALCGLYRARGDKERWFLGLTSKPLGRFVSHPVFKTQNQMLIVCIPRIKLSYIRSECKHRIPMSLLYRILLQKFITSLERTKQRNWPRVSHA
jgi:hypothetical protein